MRKTIAPAERDELQQVIDAARSCARVADLFVQRAERIVGDPNRIGETVFDSICNGDIDAGQLLKLLRITVRSPTKRRRGAK